jgi:hypothetical protein
MTHSAAQVIQYNLIAAGLGISSSSSGEWRVYRYNMPDETPNPNVICVFNSSPVPDGRLPDGAIMEHPGIMVQVRADTPDKGDNKIRAIQDHLASLNYTEVVVQAATYTVQKVTKTSGPMPIGEDDRHRHNFTLNATVTLREEI